MYHLLIPNVIREACVSNMYICSLIGSNGYFVLYLMCCFGSKPLYMDFKPIQIIFCSVLACHTPDHYITKDYIEYTAY